MKKVFLAIAVASVFTACNNGDSAAAKTDTTVVTKTDTTVVAPKVDTSVIKVDTTASKKDTATKK